MNQLHTAFAQQQNREVYGKDGRVGCMKYLHGLVGAMADEVEDEVNEVPALPAQAVHLLQQSCHVVLKGQPVHSSSEQIS